MKKRYDLYEDSVELRSHSGDEWYNEDDVRDAYNRQSFFAPVLTASYDTLAEAQAAFAQRTAYYGTPCRWSGGGWPYTAHPEITYIEAAEYDDDDNLDRGDIIDIRCEPVGYRYLVWVEGLTDQYDSRDDAKERLVELLREEIPNLIEEERIPSTEKEIDSADASDYDWTAYIEDRDTPNGDEDAYFILGADAVKALTREALRTRGGFQG